MSSSVEKGSGSLDPGERSASGSQPKACTACNTTKTPLWRGGPSGPMSLCNACGIRYRKKRREALGLDEPPRKKQPAAAAAACSEAGGESAEPDQQQQQQQQQPKKKTTTTKRGREVELRVVGFGKEVVLKQRRRMRRRPHLGEEEKAAVLLMALSSGVIYG